MSKRISKMLYSNQKVELSESVLKLLSYTDNVLNATKKIRDHKDSIDKIKNNLKDDLNTLQDDMKKVAKGIDSAESAAKLLGIKPSEVKNYSKALDAMKIAFAFESAAKKLLN